MEKGLSVVIITDEIKKDNWETNYLIDEFEQLVSSAGVASQARVVCNLKRASAAFLLGKGKIEEICHLAQGLNSDVVIFSEELSSTQQRNIEEILNIKTVDRTQLILDIFARRARSSEGKIQVELAQLEYLLPRLSGRGILLSRLGGGIGTRGPGEQKLEVDRRRIRARIDRLKRELNIVSRQRSMRRKKRQRFSISTIAIIGYTNAGKSTLLNMLTNSNIKVDDRLFSTLDPTIRRYTLPNNQSCLFIDTVGFIYRLPHNLIEAFKATLEEVIEADLLLHVLDISHPRVRQQRDATYEVLKQLNIHNKPIITILNKVDKVEDPLIIDRFVKEFDGSIPISALYRDNVEELIDRITLYLDRLTVHIKANISHRDIKVLNLIYTLGKVKKRLDTRSTVYIEAQIPQWVMEKISQRGIDIVVDSSYKID